MAAVDSTGGGSGGLEGFAKENRCSVEPEGFEVGIAGEVGWHGCVVGFHAAVDG